MSGSASDSGDNVLQNSASLEITGQIMVIAIIVLFFVVVFILFLHLYAKWFWWRIEQTPPEPSPSSRRRRHRRRFVFAPGQDPAVTLRAGLNPAILRKIPVVAFNQGDFKEGLECAVCLCELEDGEKARLLPKCNHGFHVECIDMWFQSHSTCPLCRNPVDDVESSSSVEIIDIETSHGHDNDSTDDSSPNFPTNLLFWGNENQLVSSSGACLQEGASNSSSSSSSSSSSIEMLVIDISVSSSMSEHLSSQEEESKSPMTTTRLRSLKRLFSREKRVSPCSSGGNTSSSCDVQQS